MSKRRIERKLRSGAAALKRLQGELAVAREQELHFEADAADARLRSIVSENGIAEIEGRDAARHAEALLKDRRRIEAEITKLETEQNELLDQLMEL